MKSLLITLGAAVPPLARGYQAYRDGDDFDKIADKIQRMYTGYSFKAGAFMPTELAKGWGPIVAGWAGHKLAVLLRVNRYLPKGINF